MSIIFLLSPDDRYGFIKEDFEGYIEKELKEFKFVELTFDTIVYGATGLFCKRVFRVNYKCR